MYRIALIGGGGVGKSTLAFTFSNYLEKQGLGVAVANLDPECRHIAYRAGFDIRKHYKSWDVMKEMRLGPHGALKKIYEMAGKDRKLLAELDGVDSDVAVLDTAGSLELFLLENQAGFLRRVADAVFFVCDNESVSSEEDFVTLKAVNAIQALKYSLPTLTVVNKSDLIKKSAKQQRLSAQFGGLAAVGEHLSELLKEISRSQRLFFVSAKESDGFGELFDAVNELRCECGET
ncbi:MAG: ATP/GTP-binding protein [Candidatus Micrarchaeota archaeon]|nr:ATP/GTP-binding protein [Candidatus Micrarchaeota archaeon]